MRFDDDMEPTSEIPHFFGSPALFDGGETKETNGCGSCFPKTWLRS